MIKSMSDPASSDHFHTAPTFADNFLRLRIFQPASRVYGLVSGHARLLLVGAEVSPTVIVAALLALREVRYRVTSCR